ncbi:MAG: hypothetical protein AB8G99_02755 [Planctomycetaceae bacterium]
MKTPTQAVIWENWKTCYKELALSMAGSVGIVLLMRGLIAAANKDGGLDVVRGLVTLIIMCTSMCSMFWMRELSSEGHAYTFRLGFIRPISTKQLVLIRLTYAVAGAVLSFVVPNAIFMVFAGYMPLVGPSLIVATAVTCLIAATWIPTTAVERMIAVVLVVAGVGIFLAQLHQSSDATDPYVLAIAKPGYFQLGWRSITVLVGTMVAAIFLTIRAVDRQRHGDDVTMVGLTSGLFAARAVSRKATTAFSTPTIAQLWFELRRCAPRVLALAAIAPVSVYVMARWALWMHAKNVGEYSTAWEGAPVLWGLALIVSPMVYQLLAVDAVLGLRTRENVVRFSAFDATRAMSTQRLVMIKMLASGFCSLVAWLWMWGAAVLYVFMAEGGSVWPRVTKAAEQLGDVPALWWLGAMVCVLMGFVALTGSLMTFGMLLPLYAKRFMVLFFFCYAHIGLAFLDKQMEWNLESFWTAYGYFVAAAVAAASIYVIFRALSDGSIGPRVFTATLCLWIGSVVCCLAVASKAPPIDLVPTAVLTMAAAGLLVPLAATVTAPMALSAWRHQK